MPKFAQTLIAFGLSLCAIAFAATVPVSFKTADLQGLYQALSKRPLAELEADEQRQLALLVLIRTGEEKPLKKEVVDAAKAQLERILAASKNDPEIAAIAANVRAMEAGLAKTPMAALVVSKEVTRTLDRLVKDHPDNGGVLMQRGSNALYAPEIAGRGSIAVADFEALLSGKFALDEQSCLRTRELLGLAYQKVGRKKEARETFEKLAQSKIPYWQTRAQQLLKGAGS